MAAVARAPSLLSARETGTVETFVGGFEDRTPQDGEWAQVATRGGDAASTGRRAPASRRLVLPWWAVSLGTAVSAGKWQRFFWGQTPRDQRSGFGFAHGGPCRWGPRSPRANGKGARVFQPVSEHGQECPCPRLRGAPRWRTGEKRLAGTASPRPLRANLLPGSGLLTGPTKLETKLATKQPPGSWRPTPFYRGRGRPLPGAPPPHRSRRAGLPHRALRSCSLCTRPCCRFAIPRSEVRNVLFGGLAYPSAVSSAGCAAPAAPFPV
jgi:hypothetical protein